MEILFEGKLPEEKTFAGRCSHCQTLIRFKRREAVRYENDQWEGEFATYPCPTCGREIIGHPTEC